MAVNRSNFSDFSARVPKIIGLRSTVLTEDIVVPMLYGDITPEVNRGGTEVEISLVRRKEARDVTVSHQNFQAQDSQDDKAIIPINEWQETSFYLRDDQISDLDNATNLFSDQINSSYEGLSRQIQSDCIGVHTEVGNTVGWVTSTHKRFFNTTDGLGPFGSVLRKIQINDPGMSDNFMCCSYGTLNDLMQLANVIRVDQSGVMGPLHNAEIYKLYGFYIYATSAFDKLRVSGNDPKNTSGSQVQAHSAVSVPTDGSRTSQIEFTNIKDGGLNVGDRFYFGASGSDAPTHNNDLQTHVITSVEAVDTTNHRQVATVSPAITTAITNSGTTRTAFQFLDQDHEIILFFAQPKAPGMMNPGSLCFGVRDVYKGGNGLVAGGQMDETGGAAIWSYMEPQTGIAVSVEASRGTGRTDYAIRCYYAAGSVRPEWAVVGLQSPR